jgi:AraC family transcriptional regulator
MDTRILQMNAGKPRPLSFSGDGDATLITASPSTPWAGVQFELHRTMPGEACEQGPIPGEHALVVFLEGSVEMTLRKGDRELSVRALPGSTSFLAGEERASARVKGSAVVAAVQLSPEWLHRIDLPGAPPGFGRTPALVADSNVRALAGAMRQELLAGATAGPLYAQSLSIALLSYVFDRVPLTRMLVRGKLNDNQCRRLARHVRERLGDELTLAQLAALVGLSERQFSRLFREAFGASPHRYVLDQRLEEGARLLAAGSLEIAEIAHVLGFSSQSHFTTAFRARFGTTPRAYAVSQRGMRRVIF